MNELIQKELENFISEIDIKSNKVQEEYHEADTYSQGEKLIEKRDSYNNFIIQLKILKDKYADKNFR